MLPIWLILILLPVVVSSSSANLTLTNGTCPEVAGKKGFEWELFQGRWYVLEAFDVPYLLHLTCVFIDYYLPDNETVRFTTYGDRNYYVFGITYWRTPVIIVEEGAIGNISEPSMLTTSLGQPSLHVYNTPYVIVDTDYNRYGLVYACYELPNSNKTKVEAAFILTRHLRLKPKNIQQLKEKLVSYNIDISNFRKINHTNCCYWHAEHR